MLRRASWQDHRWWREPWADVALWQGEGWHVCVSFASFPSVRLPLRVFHRLDLGCSSLVTAFSVIVPMALAERNQIPQSVHIKPMSKYVLTFSFVSFISIRRVYFLLVVQVWDNTIHGKIHTSLYFQY